MTSFFPLLKLPILSLFSVLCNTDIYDLIQFSRVSKRCRRIVKSLKNKFSGMHIRLHSNMILISFQDREVLYGGWLFGIKNEKGYEAQTLKKYYFENEDDLYSAAKDKLVYLMDLFNLPVKCICIFTDSFVKPQKILKLKIKECRDLVFKGNKCIQSDSFEELIEGIKFTGQMQFHAPIWSHFKCESKHFHCKTVFSKYASWFTRNHLFNIQWSRIFLCRYVFLVANDLLEFITRWLNSDETKFVCFLIPLYKRSEVDLSRFKLEKWDEKRRGPSFRFKEGSAIDCSMGLDLQRKDGLWATIVLHSKGIFFCVWHEQFQDVSGLEFI